MRRVVGSGLVTALAVLALLVANAHATPPEEATGDPSQDILEVNVTERPDRVNGQPAVAINPRDPDNLVFVSANHIGGEDLEYVDCHAAFSTDGGQTWTHTPWPRGDRAQCGDPNVAVDSTGTFYVAFNRLGCLSDPDGPAAGTCDGIPNKVGVATSTDGGRTWSEPVDTPVARGTTPRLRVDAATDAVHVVGGVGNPSPAAVSVSTDRGATWSEPGHLPVQPFSNQIAVHDGVVVTATAMTIVDETQAVPTEVVFQVSRDGGSTFTASPVTDSNGTPVPPAEGALVPNQDLQTTDPIPWISADPTTPDRFAVMLPRGDDLEVYLTDDAGRTWAGPTVVAAAGASKPWIEFGPEGSLGVMWRHVADGVVDTYSTVSFDGGTSFARPVRVNRTSQPYTFTGSGGDEWSRIVVHGSDAFVTWADARGGGEIDGIVARVPLSRYH